MLRFLTWIFFATGLALLIAQPSAQSAEPVEVYIWATANVNSDRANALGARLGATPLEHSQRRAGTDARTAHRPTPWRRQSRSDLIPRLRFRSWNHFAIFIDGIPVNMVSHAHRQGYADMHWLIPETVDRVEIYKGPYFAHLGDFATSGAMNVFTKRRNKQLAHAHRRQLQHTALRRHFRTARKHPLAPLHRRRGLLQRRAVQKP